MKLIVKLAIVTGLIVSVSACQKESLPVPAGNSVQQTGSVNQRMSDTTHTGNSVLPSVLDDGNGGAGTGEIVGGGDDDRDGGGKKVPKGGN